MIWSQMKLWQKIFTIAVCIITIVGFNAGMLYKWNQAPWFEHVVLIGVDFGVVGVLVKIAVGG